MKSKKERMAHQFATREEAEEVVAKLGYGEVFHDDLLFAYYIELTDGTLATERLVEEIKGLGR